MIRTAAEIVAAASAAYPDDYVAACYDDAGNCVKPTEVTGDGLAGYILAEILSSCDDAAVNRASCEGDVPGEPETETDPVAMTIARLEDAVEDIQAVIAALMAI